MLLQYYRILSLIFLAISFVGCGAESTEREPAQRTPAQEESCYSVVNGQKTSSFKAVALIVYAEGDGLFTCTGTFVSHNTMVTAAHCVPENLNDSLTFIPGNYVDLGDTIEAKEAILATGTDALTFIRGDIATIGGDQISSAESPKDLAVVIFPDNTAPAVAPIRKSNISGGEAIDLVGFGDTAINDTSSGRVRYKRHGRNTVVENEDLQAALPDLWIVAGRDETSTTDGSATDSIAAQGDSGGPLLYNGTIVGIASSAGEVPEGTGFSEIISETAMNIYASVHSKWADAIFSKAESEGAIFNSSDDSDAVQQPISNNQDNGNDCT